MNKKEKLKVLDEQVLDAMISIMHSRVYGSLADLSTAVQYLKANNVIAEKEKRTDTTHKEKLLEAKRRREEKRKQEAGNDYLE
jgi:hypothetical protein